MTTRHCLTLDLQDDPELIAEYRRHHQSVWSGVVRSLRDSGIVDAEIYLRGTRLVMILEVDASFSFEAKAAADAANPVVQEWERLMWRFQQALPDAPPDEKWHRMERIFSLNGCPNR
jgi:L-rhamnose mutarotase